MLLETRSIITQRHPFLLLNLSYSSLQLLSWMPQLRTAAVGEPYLGTSTHGDLTQDDEVHDIKLPILLLLQPIGINSLKTYAVLLSYVSCKQTLFAKVKELHERGDQIAIHTNGDAAIAQALRAIERAQSNSQRFVIELRSCACVTLSENRSGARHRLEHCQMPTRDQLQLMSRLGVLASFFVGHGVLTLLSLLSLSLETRNEKRPLSVCVHACCIEVSAAQRCLIL